MLKKVLMVSVAFALGVATGIGASSLCHRLTVARMSGFALEEVRSKIGRRVELKDDTREGDSKIINTGTVACFDEECGGYRYLVVAWDKLLPGMNHRITSIDRNTYQKFIIEEQR